MSIIANTYPGIMKATLTIALDNGGIFRERSVKQQQREATRWLKKQPQDILPAIDAWLSALSENDMDAVCCDCEEDREHLMKDAPPFLDKLLDDYFNEVC